mgnify:FL=1
MDANAKKLDGIGGWLLLVAFGLIVTPIRVSLMIVQTHLPMFSDGTWNALTSPASEHYHWLWAPLLLFEMAGNILLVLLALVTLCFFFMKSKYTPRLFITWLVFGLVFVVADYALAEQIPLIAGQPTDPESIREIVRSVVGAAIWVPYFLVSKRVKATFTREWPGGPLQADDSGSA